jgi:hypothetical protein
VPFRQITLILLLAAGGAAADPGLPPLFEAEYSLRSTGIEVAVIKRSLMRQVDGSYIYSSESRPAGLAAVVRDDLIQELSHWTFNGQTFMPLDYEYQHTGSRKQRSVQLDFDWAEEIIRIRVNDTRWQMPLAPPILDKLLYQLAIMRDLERGAAGPISYRIADGGKIKTYDFEQLGRETVQTPYGEFETVKISRRKRGDDEQRQTTLWCAAALNYLPVKVENVEPDGQVTTALLLAYRPLE